MRGRLYILDPGFSATRGHHRVANSALASSLGAPVVILADDKLPRDVTIENATIERHFRIGLYDAIAWRKVARGQVQAGFWRALRDRWRYRLARRARGEIYRADLERFLTEKNIGAADHLIVHSANDLVARPLTQLLYERASRGIPTLHFRFLAFSQNSDPADYGRLSDLVEQHHAFLYVEMEAVRRQVRTLFGIQQVDMLRLALPGARPALNRADRLRTGRKFQVLYFGDLRADKGWQRVPDIARSLSAAGDQFRVIMHVGNPWTLARQRNKAARDAINAANVEIVPGYLSDHDLTQLLADADVVILPYRAEGYSTRGSGVGLDSVAHGVPLIVSAGCTLGELVSCGNGIEAESDDDFASAIIKIRDNYPTFIAGAARAQQASKTWIADSLLPARVAGR